MWHGQSVTQIHRRRFAFLNCDFVPATFRNGVKRFPCCHSVSSRRQPLDSELPALIHHSRLTVPSPGFVARRSYLPGGRPSNLNCPELSVRLVAHERGTPCQVKVTIALRTGWLFEASTTLPEMTLAPCVWAKAVFDQGTADKIVRVRSTLLTTACTKLRSVNEGRRGRRPQSRGTAPHGMPSSGPAS